MRIIVFFLFSLLLFQFCSCDNDKKEKQNSEFLSSEIDMVCLHKTGHTSLKLVLLYSNNTDDTVFLKMKDDVKFLFSKDSLKSYFDTLYYDSFNKRSNSVYFEEGFGDVISVNPKEKRMIYLKAYLLPFWNCSTWWLNKDLLRKRFPNFKLRILFEHGFEDFILSDYYESRCMYDYKVVTSSDTLYNEPMVQFPKPPKL